MCIYLSLSLYIYIYIYIYWGHPAVATDGRQLVQVVDEGVALERHWPVVQKEGHVLREFYVPWPTHNHDFACHITSPRCAYLGLLMI